MLQLTSSLKISALDDNFTTKMMTNSTVKIFEDITFLNTFVASSQLDPSISLFNHLILTFK